MEKEILAADASSPIRILGVNGAGLESGNSSMCSGRDLPWLQDTDSTHVWSSWDVVYRDVFILDGNNEHVATYNLTEHNLADSTAYAALKSLLLEKAGSASPTPPGRRSR